MVSSEGLDQEQSLAIADAVETWVLDSVIIMGFVKRFVWKRPRLPFSDVVTQCIIGFSQAYKHRPTLTLDQEAVTNLTIKSIGAVADPTLASARDLWLNIFRVGFETLPSDGPGFRYFAALAAEQNGFLVPILDRIAKKARPVLA